MSSGADSGAGDGLDLEQLMERLRALEVRALEVQAREVQAPARPTLDHLGVAVRSLAGARGFYEALGLVVEHEETVEHEQVKVAMLGLGKSRIELLEATSEDSVIGRFVAKRGEGLHHVAIRVSEVDAIFERLTAEGLRLVGGEVKVGAGGHRYFFVHPSSTGGVLVEIVGGAK